MRKRRQGSPRSRVIVRSAMSRHGMMCLGRTPEEFLALGSWAVELVDAGEKFSSNHAATMENTRGAHGIAGLENRSRATVKVGSSLHSGLCWHLGSASDGFWLYVSSVMANAAWKAVIRGRHYAAKPVHLQGWDL